MGGTLEKALAENYMNKILNLFAEDFVLDYFKKNLLPLYPAFTDINRVTIKAYKKLVWETTYHVVISFGVYFIDVKGKAKKVPIVCVAHSDEPRENVFKALSYLQGQDLAAADLKLPRPLFFSPEFNGTFYRALNGKNLLHYIKAKDFATVRKMVVLTANLFAKLHSLPAGLEANFNPLNSRIETVIPGVEVIFKEMSARYGDKYTPTLKAAYQQFIAAEEEFFTSEEKRCLIHGDAHAENIIKTGEKSIGLIDFTDLCLGDFARDLGSFMQQLEYKLVNKVSDQEFALEMKDLFLASYLKASGQKLDANLKKRLQLYYNWTMVRTSIYWFLKFGHSEERAEALLRKVSANLGLKETF